MPTGKNQSRKMLKEERRKKATDREALRSKRNNSDQIRLLDSKGFDATRERTRLIKRIEEKGKKE